MKNIMKNTVIASLPLLLLIGSACTSVDEERQLLRGTVARAGELATEITTWRTTFPGEIPATVVDSIGAFQNRAEALHDTLEGLSAEAAAGTDLTGLKQALMAIAGFDTSRIEAAAQTDRASLMDQFRGLGANLQGAVSRSRTS